MAILCVVSHLRMGTAKIKSGKEKKVGGKRKTDNMEITSQ